MSISRTKRGFFFSVLETLLDIVQLLPDELRPLDEPKRTESLRLKVPRDSIDLDPREPRSKTLKLNSRTVNPELADGPKTFDGNGILLQEANCRRPPLPIMVTQAHTQLPPAAHGPA